MNENKILPVVKKNEYKNYRINLQAKILVVGKGRISFFRSLKLNLLTIRSVKFYKNSSKIRKTMGKAQNLVALCERQLQDSKIYPSDFN